MQKVIITCLEVNKAGIIHLLKVNKFNVKEYVCLNDVMVVLELQDYQINLLLELINDYRNKNNLQVYISHQVMFYK